MYVLGGLFAGFFVTAALLILLLRLLLKTMPTTR